MSLLKIAYALAIENFCTTKEWCKDNLGILRSDMPQIKDEHIQDFIDFIKQDGVKVKLINECVSQLKPTQSEINADKVKGMPESLLGKKPLLVSSDDHLLDGHHQWAKAMIIDKDMTLPIYKFDLPIKDLLDLARNYEKVEFRDFHHKKVAAELLSILKKCIL